MYGPRKGTRNRAGKQVDFPEKLAPSPSFRVTNPRVIGAYPSTSYSSVGSMGPPGFSSSAACAGPPVLPLYPSSTVNARRLASAPSAVMASSYLHFTVGSNAYERGTRASAVVPDRDRNGKGLRHFAMRVCQKVKQKGVTTYNEVADELVSEMSEMPTHSIINDKAYDQKNIRRRVYDALNVLMAMRIITKERKEIRWLGLPTNYEERCREMEHEKTAATERIRSKIMQVEELVLQQIALRRLIEENKTREATHGPPPAESTLRLPFFVVSTEKRAVIDCSIATDRQEYILAMDTQFELNDEAGILRRMGTTMGLEHADCNEEGVEAALRLVPPIMEPFVRDMAVNGINGETMMETAASLRVPELPQGINKQLFGAGSTLSRRCAGNQMSAVKAEAASRSSRGSRSSKVSSILVDSDENSSSESDSDEDDDEDAKEEIVDEDNDEDEEADEDDPIDEEEFEIEEAEVEAEDRPPEDEYVLQPEDDSDLASLAVAAAMAAAAGHPRVGGAGTSYGSSR